MVTLDGSGLANQALAHAHTLAASLGAKLILFRAVEEVQPAIIMASSASFAVENEERQQAILMKQAEKDLDKLVQQTTLHELKPEVVVEMGDDPAETIIDYATVNKVDLIVMSTHGRTGLSRLVYGSVTEKVLHHAPCPVLLVRSSIG
jgi:nucleotide-binding universal stress UspA family protein